jgi:hypothetical protein
LFAGGANSSVRRHRGDRVGRLFEEATCQNTQTSS